MHEAVTAMQNAGDTGGDKGGADDGDMGGGAAALVAAQTAAEVTATPSAWLNSSSLRLVQRARMEHAIDTGGLPQQEVFAAVHAQEGGILVGEAPVSFVEGLRPLSRYVAGFTPGLTAMLRSPARACCRASHPALSSSVQSRCSSSILQSILRTQAVTGSRNGDAIPRALATLSCMWRSS